MIYLRASSFSMLSAMVSLVAARPLDVLMIAVDDLRTELSIYPEGHFMHTPNVERLASRGVVFERAYVQVALCMPSRTSLLTSRRPDTSKSWTIEKDQYWRTSGGNFTTLPQKFMEAGYIAVGMGKVFHEGVNCAFQDFKHSWSAEAVLPHSQFGEGPLGGLFDPQETDKRLNLSAPGFGLVHQFDDEEEAKLADGRITDHGVEVLQNFAARRANGSMYQPFFLAIGLHKPHVPWWGPKRFWSLYPIENVSLPPNPTLPTGVPAVALQDWQVRGWCSGSNGDCKGSDCDMVKYCGTGGESPLTARFPLDNTTVPADGIKHMRQGYYATTSWTDSNIGKILDAFEANFKWNETVVVFWGDHGWQLGDNDQWAKMTNFEHATRIPLVIATPSTQPGRAPQLVEAIDIYPTIIAEAMRPAVADGSPLTPMPLCPTSHADARKVEWCTEGRSLSPLLCANSAVREAMDWSDASYSQFPRPEHPGKILDLDCINKSLSLNDCPNKMGYSIRVDKYRYTIWVGFDRAAGVPDWTTVYGEELYNHSASPVPQSYDHEHTNLAVTEPENAAPVISTLHLKLVAFVMAGLG